MFLSNQNFLQHWQGMSQSLRSLLRNAISIFYPYACWWMGVESTWHNTELNCAWRLLTLFLCGSGENTLFCKHLGLRLVYDVEVSKLECVYQDSCTSIKDSWHVHRCTTVCSIVLWSWQFSFILILHALIASNYELYSEPWVTSPTWLHTLETQVSLDSINGHISSYLAGECWLYCALVPTEHQPPSTLEPGALGVLPAQPEPPQPTQPLQQHAELQLQAATIGLKCALL